MQAGVTCTSFFNHKRYHYRHRGFRRGVTWALNSREVATSAISEIAGCHYALMKG